MIDFVTGIFLTEKVIELAPKIVQATERLWKKVRRKSSSAEPVESNPLGAVPKSDEGESIEDRIGPSEAAVRDLQSEMLATTELLKSLAEQQGHIAQLIEANGQRWESLENQKDLLIKRVEADNERVKILETHNARLAKDVQVERSRVNRLVGLCIVVGVVAVAGLAMAVRLSLQ